MMKVELPENPVDGYAIVFYDIQFDRVDECRMVYHVNTAWNDFCPDEPNRGAPLVDDWMHYDGHGYCSGRSDGWKSPESFGWKNQYATRAEATDALRIRLARNAKSLLEQAQEYLSKLTALNGTGAE